MVLTCPVGLVALGGHTGQAAAHIIHCYHPELVVDVRREAEDGRVDAARVPGVVVPHAGLEPVLLKLDDVVWRRGWELGLRAQLARGQEEWEGHGQRVQWHL